MRRQRRTHHTGDDYNSMYTPLNGVNDDFVQMDRIPTSKTQVHRFENTMEAKVEDGDTLQALALRFHCTVADIKRLNMIDKDNEIYARKVVKIPVTVHSVLLGASLPTVHTSGNNSPKSGMHEHESEPDIIRNPLEDARAVLNEKLLVASVNAAGTEAIEKVASSSNNVNSIILNSKLAAGKTIYTDDDPTHQNATAVDSNDATLPLISDILDDERTPHMRHIPGPPLLALDWSGSDCDMSWVCLFIVILALCFVIPLIYVFYIAEHPHHHYHHNSTSTGL